MRPSGLSQRFAIAMPLRRERDPGLLAARLAAIFLSVDIQSTIRESSCPAARLMADGRRGPPTGTEPDASGSSTDVRRTPAICRPVGDKRPTFREVEDRTFSVRIPT